MALLTAVPVEEYLRKSYDPDREYVDGQLVERHVGDRPHSMVQSNVIFSLRQRYGSLFVWPEQRIRTIADRRSRVPDCFDRYGQVIHRLGFLYTRNETETVTAKL